MTGVSMKMHEFLQAVDASKSIPNLNGVKFTDTDLSDLLNLKPKSPKKLEAALKAAQKKLKSIKDDLDDDNLKTAEEVKQGAAAQLAVQTAEAKLSEAKRALAAGQGPQAHSAARRPLAAPRT